MHKILPLTILLLLISCGKRLQHHASSPNLIDSVITYTIIEDSLNIFVDSSIHNNLSKWKPVFRLCSILKPWNSTNNPNNEDALNFNFNHINSQLSVRNNLKFFSSDDSSYFLKQIHENYLDTLKVITESEIWYTDGKEIEKVPNNSNHYLFYQFSKPLFNANKTVAVVGLSSYDGKSTHEGGVYLIMKRQNKKWILLKEIDWWGH